MASWRRGLLAPWASWRDDRGKWVGSSCASFFIVRERLRHQFSYILHLHALLNSLCLDTIFEHLHTERTPGGHHCSPSLHRLLCADMIHAPPNVHFHEGMAAPG